MHSVHKKRFWTYYFLILILFLVSRIGLYDLQLMTNTMHRENNMKQYNVITAVKDNKLYTNLTRQ